MPILFSAKPKSLLGGSIALAIGAFGLVADSALANTVVFNNPWNSLSPAGSCAFSTICAAAVTIGNDFAAQMFTLRSAQTINSASFTELDLGTQATAANWGLYSANDAGGLPGTRLYSGTNAPLTGTILATGILGHYNATQENFNLRSVTLGPGSYYFAVQAQSPVFETYLSQGTLRSGAAETTDGGATWASGWQGYTDVAVGLYTSAAAPGPTFGGGLGGLVALLFAGLWTKARRRVRV